MKLKTNIVLYFAMDFITVPPLITDMSNNRNDLLNESSSGEDSENEMDTTEETTICLFCDHEATSVQLSINHIKTVHNLNIFTLQQKFQMDQYAFIKLINYIRTKKPDAQQIANAAKIFWDDEKYLKPLKYEPWLTFDYESMSGDTENCKIINRDSDANSEMIIKQLQQQVKEQGFQLQQAEEDMNKMRRGFQHLFSEKDCSESHQDKKAVNCVSTTSLKADDGYFNSYAHFGIHHEMLSDKVRSLSYRDALLKNTNFVSGKDVLDVGCGTAVLSIFASKAGAKTVVGIDNSDIVYNAMDIVKKNGFGNIKLIKGRLEDTDLPQPKFDIIISEWMGYFLLFEGMLDSVIYARDHHLKQGGIILPNRCTMSIVGYGNETLYANHVTFWDNVYGLDMSNMRKEVMHEPLIDIVDPSFVLTESNTIADFDLQKVDLNYSNFTYELQLKCIKDGTISSLVGFFDTFFDLPVPISFGTGPDDTPTHWKQVVFFLNNPEKVKSGQVINGSITCRRSRNSARSLDITIDMFGQKHTYYLD